VPWEQTDDYIRSGHRSSDDFQEGSLRTITISEEEGIKAVIGKPIGKDTTEVQSYLFAKDKDWTVEKAKAWFEAHKESKLKEHVSAILPFTILEKIVDKPLRIRGLAITAGMSRNFNIYTPEELQAFASKLVAAPMYIEHVAVPNAVGKVTKTEWDGENLWYEAEIYDDETAAKIRKGLIQHVSVGADYETIDIFDGQIPHGLHNAELSLVAVPGIPEANVQVLEKLLRRKEQQVVQPIVAGEYLLGFYQDAALFLPEHFRTVWLDKENGILAVFGKLSAEPETERVQSIFFAKEKMWDQTKIQDWLSIHPDYMAPAGDSAVGKAPLIERGNMTKKQKIKEQNGGEPKTDKERFMAHFSIDEEAFQKLYDILGDELFKLLPERGQKVNEQNGEGNLTVDQIKAKIADLSKKNAEIMAQLYPEAELTDEQRATLNADSETIWAEINALETALAAAITAEVGVTLGEGYEVVLEVKLKEAEWDAEYINNLPDSSFAFIEEGGEKDEDGKTKPRSLRHLPFKDAEGNINKAHLNNALGRLAQTDLSDEAKAAAKKKLCAAVKTWNEAHSDDQITSDVCGVEPSTQEQLQTKVKELLARVDKLEKAHGGAQGNLAESLLKKSKEPTIKVTEAIKILEGLLPSPMVERSSMGMQRECQAIRGAVLQLKEMLKNG
jgi:hypothetical protein